MDETVGTKAVIWGSVGTELLNVVYDLRYMVLCAVALILADLWWGYSESRIRRNHAKEIGNATLEDKFKWHKSRAIRKSMNKLIDYVSYLVLGALLGMGITEPMGICDHVSTAALGLGIGGGCEVASIIGHVAYVKLGVEVSLIDAWRATIRFFGRLIKSKSQEIGDAVEGIAKDSYDKESNMED